MCVFQYNLTIPIKLIFLNILPMNTLDTRMTRLRIPALFALPVALLAYGPSAFAEDDAFLASFDINSAAHDTLSKLQDAGWDFSGDLGTAQIFALQAAPNLGNALTVGGDVADVPRAVFGFAPLEEGMLTALFASTSSFSNGRIALEDEAGNKLFAHRQISPVRFEIEAATGGLEDTTLPNDGSVNARNPGVPYELGYGVVTVRWTADTVRWTVSNHRLDGTVNAEFSGEEAGFFEGGPPARVVLSTSTHNHVQRVFGFTNMTVSGDPEYMPKDDDDDDDPYDGLGELIDVVFDFDDMRFDSLAKLEAWGWSFAGQLEEMRDLQGVAEIGNYLYIGGETESTPEAVLDLGGPVPGGSLDLTVFTRSSAAQGRVQLLDRDQNVLFSFVPNAPNRFWVECFGENLPEQFEIPNGGVNDLLNTPRGYSRVTLTWDEEGLVWSWRHYLVDGTLNHEEVNRAGSFFRDADPAYLVVRTLWHNNEQRAIGVADVGITLYEREVDLPDPDDEREPTPGEAESMMAFRDKLRAELLRPISDIQADLILARFEDGRFTDISYDNSGAAEIHFANLEVLALNYFAPNSKYHEDSELADKVVQGIDFWIDTDYQDWNWWHNFIGFQRRMTPVVILFADLLESDYAETHAKVVAYFRRVYDGMLVNPRGGGANLTDMSYNAIIGALLDLNIVQLEVSLQQMRSTLSLRSRPGTPVNGLYPDMTFFEHGYQLHNASYGLEFLRSAMNGIELVNGSEWDFPAEVYELIESFFLNGVAKMSYGRWFDFNAGGRSITRTNAHQAAGSFAAVLQRFIRMDTPRVDELRDLRVRLTSGPSASNYVDATTQFWFGEFISHIRPSYYTSVRLISERTVRNEMGNNEGLKNRHFGDGINFILVHGDEYDRMPVVWNYERLPGLTAEQNFTVRPETNWGVAGRNRYAGTLTDGQLGVAAMQLDHDGVRAKKSWFLFDDVVVAVGSDIRGQPTNTAVFTTLNQTRRVGDVHYSNAGGLQQTLSESQSASRSLGGGSWIWHRDVGYIVPHGNDQAFIEARPVTGNFSEVGTRTGEVTENVLTLWLNHGLNPQGKSYTYYTLPAASMEQTVAMAADPHVDVIHHDNTAHAVHHSLANTTGIAFFAAGEVELPGGARVSSDKPALVMLRERLGRMEITVSDPEYRADGVTLTIGREMSGNGAEYNAALGSTTVEIALPDGDDTGRAVRSIFHLPEEPRIEWPGIELRENGWKYFRGFGEYYDPFDRPYVFHPRAGMLYLLSDEPESIYMFVFEDNEWYWTSASSFPHAYRFADAEWATF